MGIDYSGGMIIGCDYDDITIPEEWYEIEDNDDEYEWLEENNLDIMSQWFDCGPDGWIVGFRVPDIEVKNINEEWLKHIKEKADKFKEIAGVEASLIGTQNIY